MYTVQTLVGTGARNVSAWISKDCSSYEIRNICSALTIKRSGTWCLRTCALTMGEKVFFSSSVTYICLCITASDRSIRMCVLILYCRVTILPWYPLIIICLRLIRVSNRDICRWVIWCWCNLSIQKNIIVSQCIWWTKEIDLGEAKSCIPL